MNNHDDSEQVLPEPAPNREELIDGAIRLQSIGLNPVPLLAITPGGKRPFLKTGELKDSPNGFFYRNSTIEDVREWERRDRLSRERGWDWLWDGLAVVTGETSGIFVLDSDGPEGEESITSYGDPHTWKSATGRGYQRFYRHPDEMKIYNMIKAIHPELDIKGNRGFTVVPPSLHYVGRRYAWICSPFDTPIADAPAWLISAIKLASGEGITKEEEASLPEEISSHIIENGTVTRRSGGSGRGKAKKNTLQVTIPNGRRNATLFEYCLPLQVPRV